MAISTYAELQTAVAGWLDNSTLTARIPEFITLAEAEMNRQLSTANQRPTQSRATASTVVSGEYLACPTDFEGIISMSITSIADTHIRLSYVSPDNLELMKQRETERIAEIGAALAVPVHYTIVDDQFRLFPVPASIYTVQIIYWASIPALSDTVTTNWLLTKHPDAYLYGALVTAGVYLHDNELLGTMVPVFDRIMAGVVQPDAVPTDHTALRSDIPARRYYLA